MERLQQLIVRAKRVDTGAWVEGYYHSHETSDSTVIHSILYKDMTEHIAAVEGWGCKVIPETIGRFTGLPDNDGKRVFEGDIFNLVFSNVPDGYTSLGGKKVVIEIPAVVRFKFGMFVVEYMHPELEQIVNSSLHSFLTNPEKVVIGNIHDNPELLK